MPTPLKYVKGQKFNRLTFIEVAPSEYRGTQLRRMGKFKCECGSISVIPINSVKSGKTKSCGCGQITIKHGASKHGNVLPEYAIWQQMKQRCLNPKTKRFSDYGGRGIKVCNRWLHSFENFLSDMGLRPSKSHSIDRYPNMNGNYEPANCRWATPREQMNNYSGNRLLTFNGETKSLSEWSRVTGLSTGGIKWRLNVLKLPIEKVLGVPKRIPSSNPINVANRNFYHKHKKEIAMKRKIKRAASIAAIILCFIFTTPITSVAQKDSSRVIMLVSDTSSQNGFRSSRCWCMEGYEAMCFRLEKLSGSTCLDKNDKPTTDCWIEIVETCYLDQSKIKLKPNIVVWLSKELK